MQTMASNLSSILSSSAHGMSEMNQEINQERINRAEIFRDASIVCSPSADLTEFMMLCVVSFSNLPSYLSFVLFFFYLKPKMQSPVFFFWVYLNSLLYMCVESRRREIGLNSPVMVCLLCHPVRSPLSSSLLSISSYLTPHAYLKEKKSLHQQLHLVFSCKF